MSSLQKRSQNAGGGSEAERAELARLKKCLHKVDGLMEFLGEIGQKAATAKSERDRASERAAVAEGERERLKEESEHLKKEIEELRKQQEVMEADNEKVLSLLSEERELRKQEFERLAMVIEKMELALEKKDESMQMLLKGEADRSKGEIDELRKEQERMRADNQKASAEERMKNEVAQLRVDIDAQAETVQALRIQGAENKVMQKVLSDVLADHEVKGWERLFVAAPNALNALGKCVLLMKVGQITQKRDNSIPADFQANLFRCSEHEIEAFREAESKMTDLERTIKAILEKRGIMDKVFDAVDDIRDALRSKSDEDLRGGSNELAEGLNDLKQGAERCTKDIEPVVKKFTEHHLEVTKIIASFTDVQADNLKQIKESLELLGQFFNGLHRQFEDLSGPRLRDFIKLVSSETLARREPDDILSEACQIRYQYVHAQSKASIYVEASQKYIMPGVELLDSLPGMSGSGKENGLIRLGKYHRESMESIRAFAGRLPTHAQSMEQVYLSLGQER